MKNNKGFAISSVVYAMLILFLGLVLLILGIGSACYSTYNLVYGFKKKKRYSVLLKDIQDGIFYQ